ncbi:Chitin deacetylase [Grifola frondosa]|uniref:chitin deacetylase n=1 Tax=Grifola frondosa TaxID=5627 RepID=A0A1C7MIF6_GRIFR|nr:Chitin deacetylase [Grifola frondosa]
MSPSFSSFLLLLATLAPLSSSASVLPTRTSHDDHDHTVNKRLPAAWYQPDDHPVRALFSRQEQTDGVTYPTVGSPTWSAAYPSNSADPSKLPQPWVDALNAAVSAGKIPNIPIPTMGSDGNPAYPSGYDPNSPTVCSATYQCRIPGDIWDAPDGVFGASFDDGPLDTSVPLYNFLQQHNMPATHFMIGTNILQYPTEFLFAFETLQNDICVHTWTHPYMTTLSNLQVLGELGWTMQIIHNSTGGRIPKYWRPPYGDSDVRTRAIAHEVFGLTTVHRGLEHRRVWRHHDRQSSGKHEDVANGSQVPGLIILEHELTNATVQNFIEAFPMIGQNGWEIVSVAQLNGSAAYQNSANSTDPVTPVNGVLYNGTVPSTSTNSSSAANATSTTATSGSSSGNGSSTSTSGTPAKPTVDNNQKSGAHALIDALPWRTAGLVTGLSMLATAALS